MSNILNSRPCYILSQAPARSHSPATPRPPGNTRARRLEAEKGHLGVRGAWGRAQAEDEECPRIEKICGFGTKTSWYFSWFPLRQLTELGRQNWGKWCVGQSTWEGCQLTLHVPASQQHRDASAPAHRADRGGRGDGSLNMLGAPGLELRQGCGHQSPACGQGSGAESWWVDQR